MYIINPWFFYIISICDTLKCIFVMTGIISVLFFSVWIPVYFAIEEGINPINVIKKNKWLFIVILLGATLIPSSTTCYKMLIASQVTVERIDEAKETITSVTDYIIEAVKEIEEVKNNG